MDEDLKKNILKTGTSTLGIVCKDGIVLGADNRVSLGSGEGVAYISKTITKIVPITDEILVTIAGGVSDVQRTIRIIKSELKLKELRSKKKMSVKEVANLFASFVYQNIRQFTTILAVTHFLLAGKDEGGIALYDISADGSINEVKDYTTSGSGMIHMNPIIDSVYKEEITIKEGIDLARKALIASMKRDPASGDGREIYTITKESIDLIDSKFLSQDYKDKKN